MSDLEPRLRDALTLRPRPDPDLDRHAAQAALAALPPPRSAARRLARLALPALGLAAIVALLVLALPKGSTEKPPSAASSQPRIPVATRVVAPNQPGLWYLSPTRSRMGIAATAAMGLGRPPKWVLATRRAYGRILAGSDAASFRDSEKTGFQLEWSRTFARYQFDDQGWRSIRTPRGEYWSGGAGPGIQSVYYLSSGGVAVWVGHFALGRREPVSTERLLALAERFVTELERGGDARAIPLTRQQTIVGGG